MVRKDTYKRNAELHQRNIRKKDGNKDNKDSANIVGDIVRDGSILVFDYKSESWVIDWCILSCHYI